MGEEKERVALENRKKMMKNSKNDGGEEGATTAGSSSTGGGGGTTETGTVFRAHGDYEADAVPAPKTKFKWEVKTANYLWPTSHGGVMTVSFGSKPLPPY